MAVCSFITHAVPDGPPYYANGPMRARTWCQTHNMEVTYSAQLPDGPMNIPMCPLGRIETATDEALRRIAEAQANK